jgi:hypothetical protein
MNEWGVFSVARDIWDHPVLNADEPFTRREAWMWLVSAAAWKPYKHGDCGRIASLERGEFCHSIRFLERKWNWKSGRVERFLNVLEKHDMIRDTSRDGSKVYLISKYNEYQLGEAEYRDSKRDTIHDSTATPSRQDRDKEETFNHSIIEKPSLRSGNALSKPNPEPKTEAKGTRWPSDARVPSEWFEDAQAQCRNDGFPLPDLRREAGKFERYWASKPGTAGRKADWRKTWINWVLKAAEDGQNNRRTGSRESPHEQTERIARDLAREATSGHQAPDFGADRRTRIALPRVLSDDG